MKKFIKILTVLMLCFATMMQDYSQVVHANTSTGATRTTRETTSSSSDPVKIYTIRVKYQYEDGSQAFKTYNHSFEEGHEYDIQSPKLDGFYMDKPEIKGTLTEDVDVTVTYYSEDVPYKVEHYLQNLDGTYNVEPDYVDNKSGKVGTYTTAEARNVPGFVLESAIQQELINQRQTIVGGDEQTIQLRYERKHLPLNFDTNGGEYMPPVSGLYGEKVDISNKIPRRPGYRFAGWYYDEAMTKRVADYRVEIGKDDPDNGTTIYAKWEQGGEVPYTIIYYLENPDDDGYSVSHTEKNLSAPVGTPISDLHLDQMDLEYFTYDHYDSSDKVIEGSGRTIINVYYKRNRYKLQFDLNSRYGGYIEKMVKHIKDITLLRQNMVKI